MIADGCVARRIARAQREIDHDPGRALVGNAGMLLTRVVYLKYGEEKNFAITDAAKNVLMRPALYDAYHEPCRCSMKIKRLDIEI